jgi:TetR/AcrR family transcriptional regulator, tetracycline repressor protein
LIAILLDNGFPPQLAALSYATLARFILGFAIQQTGSDRPDDASLTQIFRELDPRTFPAIVVVADHIPVPPDDEFGFGLELIVDGLTQALRSTTEKGPSGNGSVPRG